MAFTDTQIDLQQAGFAVDHVLDGEEGQYMAETNPYDAMIIDIMLPRQDGLALIEILRAKRLETPILILSALGSLGDKLKGFQSGTDDYLTKPFSFAELLARLQALLRRSTRTQTQSVLSVGDLRLDLLTRQVTRQGQKIELQPREFALLEYLMRNAGNVVDVLVHRPRNKIDQSFEKKLVYTIRGVGYVLKVP